MINNLTIKNFKCFENLSIELSNLNVFAGINSMGKSSVIQAILLLRQAYEMGITKVILPEWDRAMECGQNHPHHRLRHSADKGKTALNLPEYHQNTFRSRIL